MSKITYHKNAKEYKYETDLEYTVKTPIKPQVDIFTDFIILTIDGTLTIKEGYAWDGPSGPTIDTKSFMRGSLVHDAFFQLMREGHLDHKVYRKQADRLLRAMCIEDGMFRFRAWYVYRSVRNFAGYAAKPTKPTKTETAP